MEWGPFPPHPSRLRSHRHDLETMLDVTELDVVHWGPPHVRSSNPPFIARFFFSFATDAILRRAGQA